MPVNDACLAHATECGAVQLMEMMAMAKVRVSNTQAPGVCAAEHVAARGRSHVAATVYSQHVHDTCSICGACVCSLYQCAPSSDLRTASMTRQHCVLLARTRRSPHFAGHVARASDLETLVSAPLQGVASEPASALVHVQEVPMCTSGAPVACLRAFRQWRQDGVPLSAHV